MAKKPDTTVPFGRVSIDPAHLGAVISKRRGAIGLSLREVADKAGVSAATVHKLEQGHYKVQLDHFLAVLSVLDLLPQNVLQIEGTISASTASDLKQELTILAKSHNVPDTIAKLAELLKRIASETG